MFSLGKRHYAAAVASARRSLGIHTSDKITVKLALAAAGVFASWWLGAPKVAGASAIAFIIVFLLLVLWYLIRPELIPAPAPATLDPLYTPKGVKMFRAAQAAASFEIERLQALVNSLDKSMGKLDLTTESGQEELRRLSHRRKTENEQLQTLLRRPPLRIGYVAHACQ
jgi:hypothetical protein